MQVHHPVVLLYFAAPTRFELAISRVTSGRPLLAGPRSCIVQVARIELALFQIGSLAHHRLCVTCVIVEIKGIEPFTRCLQSNVASLGTCIPIFGKTAAYSSFVCPVHAASHKLPSLHCGFRFSFLAREKRVELLNHGFGDRLPRQWALMYVCPVGLEPTLP